MARREQGIGGRLEKGIDTHHDEVHGSSQERVRKFSIKSIDDFETPREKLEESPLPLSLLDNEERIPASEVT